PPQLGLLNVLETVSGSTPGHTNCRPFALSAFGKAVPVTRTTESGDQVVIDLPASPIPLPAYGLEDPFVWLCKRSDEIEAERLARRRVVPGGVRAVELVPHGAAPVLPLAVRRPPGTGAGAGAARRRLEGRRRAVRAGAAQQGRDR